MISQLYYRLGKNASAARQSVKLTGLGIDSFNESAQAMLELSQVIARQLPPGALMDFMPSQEQGFIVLEFANRYFSSAKDSVQAQEIEIPKTIDPFGILRLHIGNGRYTEDNEVLYFERSADTAQPSRSVFLKA